LSPTQEAANECDEVLEETNAESETHHELSNPFHTSGEPVAEDKTEVDNTLESIINKYGELTHEYLVTGTC